jgi:hypothetical protein
VTLVKPSGELDLASCDDLERAIVAGDGEPACVVYFGASGLVVQLLTFTRIADAYGADIEAPGGCRRAGSRRLTAIHPTRPTGPHWWSARCATSVWRMSPRLFDQQRDADDRRTASDDTHDCPDSRGTRARSLLLVKVEGVQLGEDRIWHHPRIALASGAPACQG